MDYCNKMPLSIKDVAKKRAIIYIRVSSNEQEDGYSIPAQLKKISEYANRKGIYIVGEPIIEIASARKTGRKLFDAMVELLRKEMKKSPEKRIDCILTEKTDRLARNHTDKETLLSLGITMHMVKENLVINASSSSNDHYIFDNNVTNATRYSRNLSEETIKGMDQKASDGLYPSNAPFGYRNVTRADNSKVIEPEPVCGPIVADMFKHYSSSRHSLDSITKFGNAELEKAGLRPHLQKSSVAHILKNPIYHGSFTWNNKLYAGKHKPLISEQLFNSANSVRVGNNTHIRHKSQKHEWLFKGLLFCECGCAMVGEIKKRKYIYYHCTGNKEGCDRKSTYVRQEEIEKHVLEILESLGRTVFPYSECVDVVKAQQESAQEDRQNEIVRIQTEIDKCERRRTALLNRCLDGKINDAQFKAHDELLENSLQEFHERQAGLSCNDGTFVETESQVKDLLLRSLQLYRSQPDNQKRRLISHLFSRCIWCNYRLHPTFMKPFDRYIA